MQELCKTVLDILKENGFMVAYQSYHDRVTGKVRYLAEAVRKHEAGSQRFVGDDDCLTEAVLTVLAAVVFADFKAESSPLPDCRAPAQHFHQCQWRYEGSCVGSATQAQEVFNGALLPCRFLRYRL